MPSKLEALSLNPSITKEKEEEEEEKEEEKGTSQFQAQMV
jgi:hypothetical protein